jgi:copper chaperone
MFKSVTFEVIGDPRLHCEGCEQRVERLLKAVPGVGQVRAQARNQRIEVLFDTTMLDAAAIAERVDKAGYQTRVTSSTSDSGS